MNFKLFLFWLVLVAASLANGRTDAKEEKQLIKAIFKNARSQTRQRTADRNYFAVNRKSPYICEFGAGCEERLPFLDILD